MRALLFTTGSPFARAIRILLDELDLDYEKREEITTPSAAQRAEATPTLQVPTFWDDRIALWESATIADYLLTTYPHRPETTPSLAPHLHREKYQWQDKLLLSTIQAFGTAATTISQMKWSGVVLANNSHLTRCAEKLDHILGWLEAQLSDDNSGFMPGHVSVQDIFLAAHVRFVQARPLNIDLNMPAYPKLESLLGRLDQRASFTANPIWWWEPGVTGYTPEGEPRFN